MRKIWAVIRREFVERVRKKSFWVMALVGPVFFAAVFVLPSVLAGRRAIKDVAVVDGTTPPLGVRLVDLLNAADSGKAFRATRVPAAQRTLDSLAAEVSDKRLDGFLIVTDAVIDSGTAEYRASNVSAFQTIGALERKLGEVVTATRLEREGVDPRLVARAAGQVQLKTTKISGGKVTGESAAQSFSLAYFMSVILYSAILIYGINVLSSVLEEKTTRIVEVLVSSLRPFQLMLGKVVGVGMASIFQFLIWGVSARLLLAQRRHFLGSQDLAEAGQVFQVPHVSGATLAVFAAYFLGGFFLYSAMFAAVGAMSSSEQEARQAQQPVMWLLILSFVSSFGLLGDPNSSFAVTLSLVPFSSPVVMPVRWAAGTLPVEEIVLSLAILAVSIVAATWVAARIYRVGMLMTGKRPSVRELVRWVRTA